MKSIKKMNNILESIKEFWKQRPRGPIGVWVMLIAYSLIVIGSPMPPTITWLEITMGCGLLIGGIFLAGSVIRQVHQQNTAKWCLGLSALLFFLPLCAGLMRGHAWSDMARDVIPLLFLLAVPILLIYSTQAHDKIALRKLVTSALVFVGICTAITFFVGAISLFGSTSKMLSTITGGLAQFDALHGTQVTQVTQILQPSEIERYNKISVIFLKLYDPAMLFAAIFLGSWGVVLMMESWRRWLPGLILACMGATIAYGFMIVGLRAYTVFFALAILTVSLTKWRERGMYTRLFPVILVACVVLWPQIQSILQLLWVKQQAVGTNGKAEEWWAVITTIYASPQSLLFGIGWGGVFENPILGKTTRFTHSMLSFYLLKTGIIGLGILLTVIGLLLLHFQKIRSRGHWDITGLILLVSCIPPLLIGALFQPTYKMLSYGLILALLVLTLPRVGKPRNCVMLNEKSD